MTLLPSGFKEWPSELTITAKIDEEVSATTVAQVLLGRNTMRKDAILDATGYSMLSRYFE